MLENVNLERKISHEEYEEALPALQRRLYDLEKACWDQKVSTVLVFEGWDAAGKGTTISTLTQRLDPRGFVIRFQVPNHLLRFASRNPQRLVAFAPAAAAEALADVGRYRLRGVAQLRCVKKPSTTPVD